MQSIPDITRGCGRLKDGATYCRGDMAPGGSLDSWSWTLGSHILGGHNLAVTLPARQMLVINLPATLAYGRLVEDHSVELDAETLVRYPALAKLPKIALLDHVGSQYYTPMSFALECRNHGPSRRIAPDIAKQIAPYVPVPILFAHAWLPLVDPESVDRLAEWSELAAKEARTHQETEYQPTWYNPNWGLTRSRGTGEAHWMVTTLNKMDTLGGGKCVPDHKLWTQPLLEDIILTEAIYGASWITRCVYVVAPGDGEDTLAAMARAGIEPVIAERQEEA